MDTKPMEFEALNQIEALLIRYGYRYAELSYDENGGDIFIIEKVEHNASVYLKYLKAQSKGRDVSQNSSNIVIPEAYVTDDFLVFAYIKPEDVDKSETYMYIAQDIRNTWKKKDDDYFLNIPKNFCDRVENEKYKFNKKRSALIQQLLTDVSKKFKEDNVNALTDAEFFYRKWRRTGGLPSLEFIREIFDEDNMYYLSNTAIFIFLLSASIIQNIELDSSFSIDWAFASLKLFKQSGINITGINKGRIYRSEVAVTYKTWVQELLSDNGQITGFTLEMKDNEESIEAYVMRDGRFGVAYNIK